MSILALAGTVCSGQSSSGGSSYKSFGFTAGISNTQVTDKVLNNIRHQGSFILLGLQREKSVNNAYRIFQVNLTPSLLSSRYEEGLGTVTFLLEANYAWTQKLIDHNDKLRLYAGGRAGMTSHFTMYSDWDDSHLYWLTNYSLGMQGILHYHAFRNYTLVCKLHSPVVNITSRPPEYFEYKTVDPRFGWVLKELHSNPSFTTLNRHFEITVEAGVHFASAKQKRRLLFLRTHYISNNMKHSQQLKAIYHYAGLTWYLK